MKNILESALSNFPDLSYCEVVDRAGKAVIKEGINDDAAIWVRWFHAQSDPIETLRIKLKNGSELIFKYIGGTFFLVIVNAHENMAQLLRHLDSIEPVQLTKKEVSTKSAESGDLKIQDAVRIQKLIIPQKEVIQKDFKKFFVVHQQQDVVGGDFYWHKKVGNCIMVALVDCTGHSVEGAMTSMVCNSLLNQAISQVSDLSVTKLVLHFYSLLSEYNQTSDQSDYGIGAELGVFCFNYDTNEIKFASTGISAFLRKRDAVELVRPKKILDYTMVTKIVQEQVFNMQDVLGIYTFTDGLTDQFDSSDERKLGYKGVKQMIEAEGNFGSDYYSDEINRWKGDNIQYDDITLLGLAI